MKQDLPPMKIGDSGLHEKLPSEKLANSLNTTIHTAMHDLRSPLNVIKPYVEFLKKVDDNEKQEVILNRMKTAVDKMEVLINKFVSYSDLICEGIPQVEQLNFKEIYSQVFQDVDTQYSDISSEIELKDDLNEVIFTYPPKYMKLILKILLDNAYKYRSPERTLKIKISITMINDDLMLEMKDNGIGFPEAFSFEEACTPFAKNSSPYRGVGLGLPALKYMIERNKGELHGMSSEDGTAILIRLIPYPLFSANQKSRSNTIARSFAQKNLSDIAKVS